MGYWDDSLCEHRLMFQAYSTQPMIVAYLYQASVCETVVIDGHRTNESKLSLSSVLREIAKRYSVSMYEKARISVSSY